jgi:hypothetical protein
MSHTSRQHGNILFIILIAVILFGALSYALSRSNVGTAESQNEKLDTEYSKYASIMNIASTELQRLVLNNCALSDIPGQSTMTASVNPKCNFFATNGGHFAYTTDGIPHVQLNKLAVPGISTTTDDVVGVIILDNSAFNKSICDRINVKNNVTYTLDLAANFFSGNWKNFTDPDGNNPGAWPAGFSGHSQGCLYDTGIGSYVMYSVLQER